MFYETSAQLSLFEVEQYFPGALPDDDWSFIYQQRVFPLIDEKKFRHLYSENKGRYNKSISTMVSLLIFMGMEKLTWRGAEFQFPRRFDWLVATHTAVGEANIDHTTLFNFYKRLEADSVCRELFIEITDEFLKACGTCIKKQRTDSFFIHGWLQILSRYGLFKKTVRKFLQSLRKQMPDLCDNIKKDLSIEYLEKNFDITEKDKTLAQRKVSLMADDMHKIVTTFKDDDKIKQYETFKVLLKVFTQQCEVKDKGGDEGSEIIIKEKPDSDTICSPHNPEVRYVRKKKQRVTGYKGFVTETCSSDNKTQFITDVQVTKATEPDSDQLSEIHDRLEESDLKPEKQYGDAGFVNGKTILESEKRGIELEGPTSGRSQSFEAYESDERPLDAGDFDITVDKKDEVHVNRCPAGHVAKSQSRSKKTGKVNVHFDADVCRDCPKSGQCPVKIGVNVSTFNIDENGYAGAVRHHKYMNDQDYRKECGTRAGAEAIVSELTRAHGMRKSRHRKEKDTMLQMIFGAIACNVKKFIRHGQNYGYLTPAFQEGG